MGLVLRVVLCCLAGILGGCGSAATVGSANSTALSNANPEMTPAPTVVLPSVIAASPSGTAGALRPKATPVAASGPASALPSRSVFALRSAAFGDGAAIPSRYTCDGADVSPALAWAGAPPHTASLVVIVTDPDAHDFVHWLAYDITGAPDGELADAVAPAAATPRQGQNDFGKRGYGGPCPPSGEHRYRFTLSALDRDLALGGTPGLAAMRAAMQGHVLASTTLSGTYRRH